MTPPASLQPLLLPAAAARLHPAPSLSQKVLIPYRPLQIRQRIPNTSRVHLKFFEVYLVLQMVLYL